MSENNAVQPNTQQHSKFLVFLSNFVSWVFHPVFMPTIVSIILYYLTPNQFAGVSKNIATQLLGIVVLNTFFFPLFATFLMKKLGFISSIKMPTMKDRIMPLMAIMIFYFWAYQVMKNFGTQVTIPEGTLYIFQIFFLGNFFGLIGVFLVNIFTKISMHTAAAGGAIGILIILTLVGKVNLTLIIIVALLVAGLIGTARMILGAHKQLEIWLGYALGIVAQLLAYWMWS